MLEVNDVVYVRKESPAQPPANGRLGTIVLVFDDPEPAYEIEYVDRRGRIIETITVQAAHVSLVKRT